MKEEVRSQKSKGSGEEGGNPTGREGVITSEATSDNTLLPASRKIYVETNGGDKHNLRVPFREITLSPSKDFDGNLEENPPVRVYDTSGVRGPIPIRNMMCGRACQRSDAIG